MKQALSWHSQSSEKGKTDLTRYIHTRIIHHCDDHVRQRRASVVLIASCTAAAAAVEAGEKERRRRKAKENAERRDDRIFIYIYILQYTHRGPLEYG